MEMWTCLDEDYISSVLNNAMGNHAEVTLWQSKSQGKEKFYGSLVEFENGKVEIEILRKEGFNPLSATDALFVHISYRDVIFKRDNFSVKDNIVSFPIPFEMKIKDRRHIPRYYYKYQDFKNVSFHTKGAEGEVKYSVIMVDISTDGVSYVTPSDEIGGLSTGSDVFITSITDQKFPNAHKARCCILANTDIPWGKRKTNLTKVGLKFVEPLESISYKSIKSIVTKKQERVKGLEVSSFNGLHPEDQQRILNSIQRDNLSFAKNLREQNENLDRLRYLTTTMKQEFMMRVNHDLSSRRSSPLQ